MKKEEIMIFAENALQKDEELNKLIAQKCEEFSVYYDAVVAELVNTVQEYFPPEICALMCEYSLYNDAILVGEKCGELKVYGTEGNVIHFIAMNDWFSWLNTATKDKSFNPPHTLDELNKCARQAKTVENLSSLIKREVDAVYDILAEWKTRQLNYAKDQLLAMNFGTKPAPAKTIKVTVLIEEL